jgi:hypothetical protein
MTLAALKPNPPGCPIRSVPGFDRHLLNVDFEGPHGARLTLVGGGETVEEAIEAARAALPAGAWRPVRWNDVWGS